MATAMQRIEIEKIQTFDNHSPRRGLHADLIDAIMKRIRPGVITLLDMRTEFEVIAPGDLPPDLAPRDEGPIAALGLAIMSRMRRAASLILDPWTEFEILD
jgi:hypothetical protein